MGHSLNKSSGSLEDQPIARIARFQEVVRDVIAMVKANGYKVFMTDEMDTSCEIEMSRGREKRKIAITMNEGGFEIADS